MRVINFELPKLALEPDLFDPDRETLALLYLERDICMFQTCQNTLDVLDTVFDSVRVGDYIVEVHEACFLIILSQYDMEGSLEGYKDVC